MDRLSHNAVIKIATGRHAGIYRVILDEVRTDRTVVVRIDDTPAKTGNTAPKKKAGKKKKAKRHPPLIGRLIWIDRDELESLHEHGQLLSIRIEPESIIMLPQDGGRAGQLLQQRMAVMADFLDFKELRTCILCHHSIGPLIAEAIQTHGVSRTFLYQTFSLLCRYGFSDSSLHVRYDRCGAPGVHRPCDPGGRKKPGRKTTQQRILIATGQPAGTTQPGMSSIWRSRIMAADHLIPAPKPPMPKRLDSIIKSHFMTSYRQEGDKLIELPPTPGEYPNKRQIIRVLTYDIPDLERARQKTTRGHFDRNMRGAAGRSWHGVPGPGYTWAIDSTIGDVYLRSSLNRAWVLGRPIVYVLVDVWSTAVVGFHVCLEGPSWDMAKVALFNAGVDHLLVGELWGCQLDLGLDPAPTLAAQLLADRGEYISAAARLTGLQILPIQSYTAPYRPDYKGIVEVLHRIAKDTQYRFVPGAIDARRKELEAKRFKPDKSALTLREYVLILYNVFREYNLTADRAHRLDAHMKAARAVPTPAGLWRWGHQVGIGFRREVPFSELVSTLLPQGPMSVTRSGILFARHQYECPTATEEQWVARARNYGYWQLQSYYFPGSVGRIWTPNLSGAGLLELHLSDHSTASPELTVDEVVDAHAYHLARNDAREHELRLVRLDTRTAQDDIIANAVRLTTDAEANFSGKRPPPREARRAEIAANAVATEAHSPPAHATQTEKPGTTDEANLSYVERLNAVLSSMNEAEVVDEPT